MANFGSITLDPDGKSWVIRCDIHVWTKLKRLFAQVPQRASDHVKISNTPENCRDLEWFIQRFPMTVTPKRALAKQAKEHREQERSVELVLARHVPPAEFETELPPREYQQYAATLLDVVKGLLLADEVGVGKTLSGILPMTKPKNLPALVVTMTHLTGQWVDELRKFAPSLKVHVLKTGRPVEASTKTKKSGSGVTGIETEDGTFPDVIVCNYHKLHGWYPTLAGHIKYVVFDEVHELRRSESLKYAAAKYISDRAQLRMGLSATPIMNMGSEIFNVIEVLKPGALGTHDEFIREWCNADAKRLNDPKALGAHLRTAGIFLRRTRKEIGRELPPVAKIVEMVDCNPDVINEIKGSAIELARTILRTQERTKGERFRASGEFNLLMRQATGVAKAPYVAEFCRLLLETQEKIVLFGWHRDVYSIWMEALAEFKPVLYTGSESPKQKDAAKKAFVEGDSRVIIISLRAGAGLNGLQEVCNTAVFGEFDWSPGVHEQCTGRVWRDGVLGQVMAYYLMSEEGSDPEIASVLGIKLSQIQGIRDPDADIIEELEVEAGNVKRLAESYLARLGARESTAEAVAA